MDTKNRLVKASYFLYTVFFFAVIEAAASDIAHHDLRIAVDPERQHLRVVDLLTSNFGPGERVLEIALNEDLALAVEEGWEVEKLGRIDPVHSGINASYPHLGEVVPVCRYRLRCAREVAEGKVQMRLSYEGQVRFPLAAAEEHARSFQETPGLIGPEGMYLSGATFWYPQGQGEMSTFRMEVSVPPGWFAVSQGEEVSVREEEGGRTMVWECPTPVDEIYLCGGPLVRYESKGKEARALVYLRKPDRELAEKYLAATHEYLEMYGELLGRYPYRQFALVENFWESGYGMPGFTLLGPKIIRFPFIIRTSYPHEILHNWWGNGVFVDYRQGNWCEGLTAYLADHLMKERQGEGAEYRRGTLQRYRDFVRGQKDFALAEFRARHSPASEAVGYGKGLMLFHELRLRLGDKVFVSGLRRFYEEFRYHRASFADLEKTFAQVSGRDLERFFHERVDLKGAPQLHISDVRVRDLEGRYLLQFTLGQETEGGPWQLEVPVAVTVPGQSRALWIEVPLDQESTSVGVALTERPLRIDVDPQFDLFRKVHRSEIPPSVGQIFGAEETRVVVPAKDPPELKQKYQDLFGRKGKVQEDGDMAELPRDASLWLLGHNNHFAPRIAQWLSLYGVRFAENEVAIGGRSFSTAEHLFVLTTAHPGNEEMAVGFIFGDTRPMAAAARKLPHYGKYSYLVFQGEEAVNVASGQWPLLSSVLSHAIDAQARMGEIAPRTPLSRAPEIVDRELLSSHVRFLSSGDLQGRGLGSDELDVAAEYIAAYFAGIGLNPAGDGGSFFQDWQAVTGPQAKEIRLRNVVAVLPGRDARFETSPLILGAHYDHLGRGWPDVKKGNLGQIHPGADDNASGVAVLLELARIFKGGPSGARPIIFVAFTGEEAGKLGSRHFASRFAEASMLAMVNLDTVGRLQGKPILALGANSAKEWPDILRGCSHLSRVQVTPVNEPLDSSDHMSFIERKIPALQIFTGAHGDYHTPADTADKVDVPGMAQVVVFVHELAKYLAGREAPLTQSPPVGPQETPQLPKKRTSLGSIPDFTHEGKGVRLAGTTPNSPAARAGLGEGDIVVKLGEFPVEKLSDLARALGHYRAGDRVRVQFLRQTEMIEVEVTLEER